MNIYKFISVCPSGRNIQIKNHLHTQKKVSTRFAVYSNKSALIKQLKKTLKNCKIYYFVIKSYLEH